MITVACVTFSLTLLADSHATGQFGPRLLINFMRDRGNQITLVTFTSTFIINLLSDGVQDRRNLFGTYLENGWIEHSAAD